MALVKQWRVCETCGLPALVVAETAGRAWCHWHRTDPQNTYEGAEEQQRRLIKRVLDYLEARIDELEAVDGRADHPVDAR